MSICQPITTLALGTPFPQSSASTSQSSLQAIPLPGPPPPKSAPPGPPLRGSQLTFLSACRCWHFSWCVPIFYKHTFNRHHGAIYRSVRNQLNKVSGRQRSPLLQFQKMKNPSALLDFFFGCFLMFSISHVHPTPTDGSIVQTCRGGLRTRAATRWTIASNILIIITSPSSEPFTFRSLCVL